MSDDLARRAAADDLLVVAGFWLDAFDRDRRRLVDAAVAALVAGHDSPALRELAGLYGDEEWSTVDALVLATARELDLPRPSVSRAVRLELVRRCRAVLAGQMSERALSVWADSVDGPMPGDGRFPDLRTFVGFESHYLELDSLADFPEYSDSGRTAGSRARLEAAVREGTRRVLRSNDGVEKLLGRREHQA
ncbi:hypothetical protein [Cellulosimicrobium sp. NPDC057862]|uniref:hypothetical protein n=1 Tax=Cellulosimicrobium sp. NPDC057862 TaxID=3346266 RepID=UPI00366C6976